jgi:hypothetical protein
MSVELGLENPTLTIKIIKKIQLVCLCIIYLFSFLEIGLGSGVQPQTNVGRVRQTWLVLAGLVRGISRLVWMDQTSEHPGD